MTNLSPDRSEWKTVWLGSPDNPEHQSAGWLPVEAEVRTSQLAVFERKVTIGDASKDSDDYISSWILSDFSGGLGVRDLNEGADTNKFYWGMAETRFVSQVALPPLAAAPPLPGGVTGGAYPLGDVYGNALNDRGSTVASTFYVAWGPDPGSSNQYAVVGYNEATDTWHSAAATKLTSRPLEKGTPFCGYASDGITSLYVPMGASGYARITETTGGSATVTNVAAGASSPKAVTMCVFTDRLFALDTDGRLWKTPGKVPGGSDDVWTLIQAPSETSSALLQMKFDRSQTPRKLISYVNRSGEPALCLVTDSGLLMFEEMDTESGRWQQTAVQYPPHPDFGLAAAVWRPGEDLHIAAGMDTVRFTSANVIVPLSGPSSGDGVPKGNLGKIVDFAPELSCLYAMIDGDSSNENSILAWTSTGWHCVWMGGAGTAPTWMVVSKVSGGYRLWWGFANGVVYAMPLRQSFHNPRAVQDGETGTGLDQFASTGFVITGRFDANMTGFNRIASHVVVDADWASPTDKILIEYQTESTDTWQTLGTVTSTGVTSFSFDPDGDTFSEGLEFNWIQFKMTFSRGGGNDRISPILRSMMMGFVKIPQNTESFVFTVPLPKRTWMGRTANEIVHYLEGLLTSGSFLKMVHQDNEYRVKVAGVSGADATGDDYSGARTVNVIAIPEGP